MAPAGIRGAPPSWLRLHIHARTCMNDRPMTSPPREAALWDGRFEATAADAALALSDSLDIDLPLAMHDVAASRVHVAELERLGLIDASGRKRLDEALAAVAQH